ncbi:MAG TPA: MBL fold metallo-hydrolase [Acidothermaceae bacterium]|nr:MBL fold metallo-hydrolase [Acidothermaceae bacterium]
MQLTKYTHSCVRIDDGDRALVIDPGMFSETTIALDGAHAVLITHEHADHIDAPALIQAARANAALRIWAPAGVAQSLTELGDQVTAVGAGESFDAAGFAITTFGGLHALIHPLVGTLVANVCYLVDGRVYHPGDSFTVPPVPVETLLIPIHAPWSKIGEVIDFAAAVRAPHAYQIHDALLNDIGSGMVDTHVGRIGALYGTTYKRLAATQTVDV